MTLSSSALERRRYRGSNVISTPKNSGPNSGQPTAQAELNMTDEALTTVSPTALAARRQQLRRQRQVRIVQALWRNAALLGLTAGMVWATALPKWLVYTPEQIEIQGNKILSEAAIRESLDIDYPQSLLVLQPSAIATQLEANAPIAEAAVTRRLFPPGLIVQVQERKPVAIALPDTW
ncbi:MAG: FtsQ-type POTRA domain-containing protein [Leptolyngbyaceae cyanobacterium SM1_1_3]|nr:FtsQ-type POTRA domain-containing protein [Leptolyngbyaceae cyanobacterium SM1_1_3]